MQSGDLPIEKVSRGVFPENDELRYRITKQDGVTVQASHPSDVKSLSYQNMPSHFFRPRLRFRAIR